MQDETKGHGEGGRERERDRRPSVSHLAPGTSLLTVAASQGKQNTSSKQSF